MAFKLTYIDHVQKEGNAFSDYGSLAHKLLEEYEKGEIPYFLLAEEYKARYDEVVSHPFPPFPKGMGQKYYEQGLEYFQNFEGFGDQYEILDVEEKFTIEIGGYPFVGVVDLILRDKQTDQIIVVDHKSKSKKSMHKEQEIYRRQLYTYAAFVKEKYGKFPSKLKFNMFKDNYWIEEDFNEQEYDDTIQWVVGTIEAILHEPDWLVCPSSFYCRFICSVFSGCPAQNAILNPPPKEPGKRGRKKETK